MKRCGQTHGRDLQYTGTAQHNSRIHQVRCFYDEKDGTRPAPEVGEEQEGEGRIMDAFNKSIAYISNKFPDAKDGLARPVEAGEHHQLLKLPGGGFGRANFSGPGTNLKKRLRPPKAQARSGVDRVAENHDMDYYLGRTENDIRTADRKMIRNLAKVKDSRFNIGPAYAGISSKMKLEDYGLMKKDKFISTDPRDPMTTKRARRRQRQLAQEGLGLTPSEMLLKSLNKKKKKKKRRY